MFDLRADPTLTEPRSASDLADDRPRLGPRPLPLHVAYAEMAWRANNQEQLVDFFRGIKAYRDHPYRRAASPRYSVWQAGGTRLEDYGPSDGWPLLVVPSLINRAYVLDLIPNAGLLSFLQEGGVRPLLLDWGAPAPSDRRLILDDLVLGRLEVAFDWILDETGQRPLMLGYCMGGVLATALASRRPSDCAGLALLAAPWNFQEDQPALGHLGTVGHALARFSGRIGSMPVDLLQTLFSSIDPMTVPRKFANFAKIDPMSEAATRFVAIEDWLNDGVPLGADLAAECLIDWYGRNTPGLGEWKVGEHVVRPEQLDLPAFLAIPCRDRIVPAGSALALAALLPRAEIIRPQSGHIGMVAGKKAKEQLWKPLLAWLLQIAAMQKSCG
ncbi:MAG: alpha/beta fold hydrolase [Geminicoccaceae bacterium]